MPSSAVLTGVVTASATLIPGNEPAAWLAAKHSHPLWIVEGWLAQLGFAEAAELAAAMSAPPPFTIRVNRLKIERDALQTRLQAEGVTAVPCHHAPDGLDGHLVGVAAPSAHASARGCFPSRMKRHS